MSDRPTPEQIAERSSLWDIRDIGPEIVVADIRAAGYVIVHPDDVPRAETDYSKGRFQQAWDDGHNWLRDRLFAAEQETPLQQASREVTEQQDQRQP